MEEGIEGRRIIGAKGGQQAVPDSNTVVTKEQLIAAFEQAGVGQSGVVLTHSSLKSLGHVVGGSLCVIDALKETVTSDGTVVFPTLVQQDFANAYRNWDVDKSPSDVGLITETFRLLPDSVRSDQATHSVAAWGKKAKEFTSEHSAYGPRMGIFGDYCFSYSSPWQKMYFAKTKIIFIGVDMVYNTFKHFVEYLLVEHYCQMIVDPQKKCLAMSKIARHNVPGVWPLHDATKTQAMLEQLGLLTFAHCGNARMIGVQADAYVDHVFRAFIADPAAWFDDGFLHWLENDVFNA